MQDFAADGFPRFQGAAGFASAQAIVQSKAKTEQVKRKYHFGLATENSKASGEDDPDLLCYFPHGKTPKYLFEPAFWGEFNGGGDISAVQEIVLHPILKLKQKYPFGKEKWGTRSFAPFFGSPRTGPVIRSLRSWEALLSDSGGFQCRAGWLVTIIGWGHF